MGWVLGVFLATILNKTEVKFKMQNNFELKKLKHLIQKKMLKQSILIISDVFLPTKIIQQIRHELAKCFS